MSQSASGPRLAVLVPLVAGVLIASVVALVLVTSRSDASESTPNAGSGGSSAVTAPSSTATSPSISTAPSPSATSAAPKLSTSPVADKSSTTKTPSPAAKSKSMSGDTRKPMTYTVKRGDNLTVIAAWFKLHGYGDLYERNKKVIGSDPDLIRPGQRITISTTGVSTSR